MKARKFPNRLPFMILGRTLPEEALSARKWMSWPGVGWQPPGAPIVPGWNTPVCLLPPRGWTAFRPEKNYQKFIKDYLRCGAAIDENIGKLLGYLKESGLSQNTVAIYTSDQGYFLGEHGFFDKRLFYEESLRMPFVIRYPKEIKAGARVDDIILNVDFSALFDDYAGLSPPKFLQGRSFRTNLTGHTPRGKRAMVRHEGRNPLNSHHNSMFTSPARSNKCEERTRLE